GRQPEETGKIQLAMIIIAALAEALTSYAFVTMFILSPRIYADRRGAFRRGHAGSHHESHRLQTGPDADRRIRDHGLPAASLRVGTGARPSRGAASEDRGRVRGGGAPQGGG